MFVNLLAMLLSLAMAMTGAPAGGTLSEPVGRVVTVENIALSHNGEEVALAPRAVFGVSTDGAQAVFDFFIDLNGEHLLPLQAVADARAVALMNDTSGAAVKVTAEDIDALTAQFEQGMSDAMGGVNAEDQKLLSILTDEFLPAYQQMLQTLTDEEQARAFQAQGDALFAEMVDRGEGEADTIEYGGENIPVTVYHYTLNAAQLGALCDAVLAANPATQAYADAYFKLLAAAAPEDNSGLLAGVTNYETLMSKTDTTLQMTESVAESGLTVQDGSISVAVPGLLEPLVMNIYGFENGSYKTSEVSFEQTLQGTPMQMSMEATQDGEDIYASINFAVIDPDSVIEAGEAFTAPARRDPALIDAMVADILSDINEGDDAVTAMDKASMRVEGSGLPADEVMQAVVDALKLENVTIERTSGEGAIADVTVTVEGEDNGAVFYIMENLDAASADEAEAPDPAVEAAVNLAIQDITVDDSILEVCKKALTRAEEADVPIEPVLEGVLKALGLDDEQDDTGYLFQMSMDGFSEAGESEGDTEYGCSFSVARQDMDFSAGLVFGGVCHEDSTSESYLFSSCEVGEEYYGFSCDINVTNATIAPRVNADEAQSISEFNPTLMLAGLGVDGVRLMADKTVKDAIALLNSRPEAAEAEQSAAEAEPVEAEPPAIAMEPTLPSAEGVGTREAEPYDDGAVSYGVPQFGWLPDGYRIETVDVDTQYDIVDYTLSNPDTGDEIYAFFSASYCDGALTQYLIGDGNIVTLNGATQTVVSEENNGDIRRFSMDDGKIALSLYPHDSTLSDTDIVKIIAGIHY